VERRSCQIECECGGGQSVKFHGNSWQFWAGIRSGISEVGGGPRGMSWTGGASEILLNKILKRNRGTRGVCVAKTADSESPGKVEEGFIEKKSAGEVSFVVPAIIVDTLRGRKKKIR